MEARILLWIHGFATPGLDQVFLFSNTIGTMKFCVALVAMVALYHLIQREWREAAAWMIVGPTTYAFTEMFKPLISRPRPELWATIIHTSSFSFPSGHAVASATFYPLLGWVLLRRRGSMGKAGYGLGLLIAVFVGVGRLYLGVHWPTDVMAGWLIGAAQSGVAVAWLRNRPPYTHGKAP